MYVDVQVDDVSHAALKYSLDFVTLCPLSTIQVVDNEVVRMSLKRQ